MTHKEVIKNINSEIVKRVIDMMLSGHTKKEIKLALMGGKITSVKMADLIAEQYIKEALSILDSPNYIKDYGIYALYRGAIAKKDYKTAFSILKEMGGTNSDIVIKVVKD